MADRPDCHELEDVVKPEVQGRPWCRKPTHIRNVSLAVISHGAGVV